MQYKSSWRKAILYKKTFLLVCLFSVLAIFIIPLNVTLSYPPHSSNNYQSLFSSTAIILGAGVSPDGKPREMLQDRLKKGAELYKDGAVEKLLVSGDNSAKNYHETDVMERYLIDEFGILDEDIDQDPRGSRTYDSCARAKEVYHLDEAILVSQDFHLPRAVMLCQKLGVDAVGVSASMQDYTDELFFRVREFFAIHKALIDLYLVEPEWVEE